MIQLQGGVVYAAWIETTPGATPLVWAQRFDGQGHPLSAPVRAGEAAKDTWNLNAAVDEKGVHYVVWDARLGSRAKELRLAVVGDGPVREVQLSPDDGHASVYPDLKIGPGGQAALTWFDNKDGNEEVYLTVAPLAAFASGATLPPSASPIPRRPRSALTWPGTGIRWPWCGATPKRARMNSTARCSGGTADRNPASGG